MAFAFNYVGHYVTPWDWINHPEEVTCHSRRSEKRGVGEIALHASCDSSRNLQIDIDIGHNSIQGTSKVNNFISYITCKTSLDWLTNRM